MNQEYFEALLQVRPHRGDHQASGKTDATQDAYNRGAHEALSTLLSYVDNHNVDPKMTLKQFEELAGKFRFDKSSFERLLHMLKGW